MSCELSLNSRHPERLPDYRHSPEELEFGARVAWRNSSRCIGRLTWRSLRVLDQRQCNSPEEVYQACLRHLEFSTNQGNIIPAISIFAPVGPRIHNSQLLRYADDPEQGEFVTRLGEHGWAPSGKAFQTLPLMISWPGHQTLIREIPSAFVLEVPLSHPDFSWFSELGLRWHALPAMSDRVLEIGGIHYPCAPFSGWYMGTEIGARNLADEKRYNLLPKLAQYLNLDTSSERSLWRDRCLVELNRAVLHSFQEQGVSLVDHHTASKQFLKHVSQEQRAGREVPADWTWIVPPISGSATGVFHTAMRDRACTPNFLSQQP